MTLRTCYEIFGGEFTGVNALPGILENQVLARLA